MKKWLTLICIIICLIDFCYVRGGFLYAQYLDDNDDSLELRVWNLKQQIKIEEEAIGSLKKRHIYVLKEKQRIQKVIEREKARVSAIEKAKDIKRKLLEAKRQKEQERQLFLLEQIMLNQSERKKFLERIEKRKIELEKQKQEHEAKLSKEEAGLQELELELVTQKEQERSETQEYKHGQNFQLQRQIEMQKELEAASSKTGLK